ncbi:hypothetical protein KUV50_10130 [Membranicola marinus]|uniref:Glycosyl hydrolase family 67 N-terminus n=1 Tax=Membranihabitans marinus TaxID=1227546 RepID=A0A953HUL1_9BACT|nr:hypothetical protein [Membranihabitans marinus]MBY5958491.1 hypothetical protein [Membranihabitans marinus]
MKKTRVNGVLILFLLSLFSSNAFTQMMDLRHARIIAIEQDDGLVSKSIVVLKEEVEKRTGIELIIYNKWSTSDQPSIFIGLESDMEALPQDVRSMTSKMPPVYKEGYKIAVSKTNKTVAVIGADKRGVLYGVGKLLRTMEMRTNQLLIPQDFNISSSPAYPIRGHQLGYRPKTNSYDAWTVNQFDQYIRDLAVFGANSIEIMPPRTDDDFTNIHMKLPASQMMVEQSRICDSYGMDVWMWYPNLGSDYTHPDSVARELEERSSVFKALPRLDHLFVPGGDPGDLEPDVLFEFLKKEAKVLHQFHPEAKIWVSPQVFRPTQKWFDAFYAHVNQEYDWFGGVVFGPWIKTPIEEIREKINPGIPIRRYPDITHSLSSQYPIPKWDLAYAITLGRECINPRPVDEKAIHNAFDHLAQGSISYSEGTNDDVNKMVWSDQDWNPETPVMETLREYARYFISPDLTHEIASGMLALEENIMGPLMVNDGVLRTLQQWQDIARKAPLFVKDNYRFQMGLIRAYFDAYTYRRLIYETELEHKARAVLAGDQTQGSLHALNEAREVLTSAWKNPVMPEWKKRCLALADSLFNSIGAQLTVEKHHAAAGRGNFIDNIDLPLNDAMWLLDRISVIEKLQSESDRRAQIEEMLQRTNPGPGGYYDNFGSPRSWARVRSNVSWAQDPGSLLSPRVSFGVGLKNQEWVHEVTAKGFEGSASPVAWMNQVTALYDQPLEIEYDNLDPKSGYTIRVAYTGRFRSRMKMLADDLLVHDFIQTGIQPIYEFEVPMDAVADGQVVFKWTCGEGERGAQVSEVWLIKEEATAGRNN